MHPMLTIQEILESILIHLDRNSAVGWNSPVGRRNFAGLAAFARTCKTFKEPALDVLWKEQRSLNPILRCLPSDSWEEYRDDSQRGISRKPAEVRILRPLESGDWEVLLKYSKRVRSLRLCSFPYYGRYFPTLAALNAISTCPAEYVFPELRELVWEPTSNEHNEFLFVRRFLTPNLAKAQLRVPYAYDPASLLSLPLPFDRLEKLCILCWPKECCSTSSMIALELSWIQSLTLDTLDLTAIRYISQLSALKELYLCHPDVRDLSSQISSPGGCYPFYSLRSLGFYNTTIEYALEFIGLLSDCRLRDMHISTTDEFTTKLATGRLFATMARNLAHSTLQSLHISNFDDGQGILKMPDDLTLSDYALDGRTVAPLFNFTNVTTVTLRVPGGFNIDDASAWDMARSWAKIALLCLDSFTEPIHSTRMTLHGLRAFAQHCKHLHTLTLAVDASQVEVRPFDMDNLPGGAKLRVSQEKLETLDVVESPISSPPAVACALSALFPRLKKIKTWREWMWTGYDSDGFEDDEEMEWSRENHSQWVRVEEMLPMLRAVRAEERYWARLTT